MSPRTHPNAVPVVKRFWVDVAERAGKTFVQAFAATAGLSQLTDVVHIDWQQGLVAAGVAAAASVVTSIASAGVQPGASASLVATAKVQTEVEDVLARVAAAVAAAKVAPPVVPAKFPSLDAVNGITDPPATPAVDAPVEPSPDPA